MSWLKDKEFLSILAMLGLTSLFFVQTPDNAEAGASIFPHVLMWLMLALAAWKSVIMLMFPPKPKEGAGETQGRWRFWFVALALIAYVWLVEIIGYYAASFLFFFGVTLAIQVEERGPRSIAIRLAVVFGFMMFLYVLFTKVLMVQLPKGMFF